MRKFMRILALALTLLTVIPCFASCGGTKETEGESESESVRAETETEMMQEEEPEPMLSCNNAALIEYAERIANGVNYCYTSPARTASTVTNREMSMTYDLDTEGKKLVAALTNSRGVAYVENSMDVFVRMKTGDTYYASESIADATSNLFRLGYYFYQAQYEGQDFISPVAIEDEKLLDHTKTGKTNNTKVLSDSGDEVKVQILNNSDPYLCFEIGKQDANKYNLLCITMKSDSDIRSGNVYIKAGSYTNYSNDQKWVFTPISNGEYHTYIIPLYAIKGYEGSLTGVRLDLDGKMGNGTYTVSEMKLLAVDTDCVPAGISLARSFYVYSDKMHHRVQISAAVETGNIDEVGLLTEIAVDRVQKMVIKDKTGLHDSPGGVDWPSVKYLAFDIKDAGVFGYILPADNTGGKFRLEIANGYYTLEQYKEKKGGTILPSAEGTENANDFTMGQRIYTDETHSFDTFLREAEAERKPFNADNFSIDSSKSNGATFAGYDAERGIYVFKYSGTGTGYGKPNYYPTVRFTVRGAEEDRKIYIMTTATAGTVECAALLDENDMLLPVPVEVGKNFSEAAGERNLYNLDDPQYSETIIPMVVKAGERAKYSMVHIYQNWGRFPLKQASWIQFRGPYYHLSLGVTETSCITPFYTSRSSRDLAVLPDFRAMSAPFFSGQQKNSGGTHNLLTYTDADGNFNASEATFSTVGSYGPTYADVTMGHLSDDGKIRVTYNHMEMPQTDENRTYYQIQYEVLEDLSIRDFAKDFAFYSVSSLDSRGIYTLVGYLDENNRSQVVEAKRSGEPVYYTLGDEAPYFSYMKMINYANSTGYVNVALLVQDSSFIIGGKSMEPNFVLADRAGTLALSLDLDQVELKAGDTFTINCILMPWGSQETVYDSAAFAPDQNVRDVRENTILDPLKPTAVADCEVIDAVYLPLLKTTNGTSAEFTLSGGHNNVAVRIYGFKTLIVPKIYEKIGGAWVEYEVSSENAPDSSGNAHAYDGYAVYYDGDGTFSYSFVTAMDNGAPRTFKIVVE